MKQSLVAILSKLLAIAQNTSVWIKVMVSIVILAGAIITGAFVFSKTKHIPCEDCSPFKQDREKLIQALIDIKTSVKEIAASPTNYIMDDIPLTYYYASFDTLPHRKKPPTKQQIKLGLIVNRIDSMLAKMQQQQQVQIKH